MSGSSRGGAAGAAIMSFPMLLAILIGAEFTSAMATGMIYTALSKLYAIYGDPAHVTWLVTAFALSSAGSAVLFSRLGDIYGRGLMLKWMLVAVTVGCAVSALATDLDVIILGRALQGMSTAILPLGFGILREFTHDSRQLNFGVGLLGGTYALSVGMGVILSGIIIDNMQWQHIFTVTGIASALILVMTLMLLPNGLERPTTKGIDWLGALVIVPVSALLLALTLGKSHGWSSPEVLGLLIGGAVSLAIWVIYELRHPDPLVELRLLKDPTILTVNLLMSVTALGPTIYPQVVLPLLQQPVWTGVGFGVTATVAGLLKLPTNLTSGIASIAAGLVARKYSLAPAIVLASVMQLVAFAVLIFSHDSMWVIVGLCVVLVAPAATIIYGCAPGLIIEVSPPERTSEATGLASVLRSLASSIGTQLVALSLASSSIVNDKGTRFPDDYAYTFTFGFITLCCVGTMILAFIVLRRRGRTVTT